MKRLFLTLAACAALCACSKDDADSQKTPVFTGDTAYLNVRISDAATRASAGDPNEFENGSANEYAVSDAKFYFYDANEAFVTQASVWNGGDPVGGDGNIEFNGNSVVVLRGLTGTSFPKYMVTVLNAPAGFQPGQRLDGMLATMAGSMYNNAGEFVMSTTSHPDQKDADNGALPYYVTEVTAANFSPEPVKATFANTVAVYVERLAAKVSLRLGDLENLDATTGRCKLNVSVAGELNGTDDGTTSPAEGATDIYIEFLGWALNGTALDSYMMKNIDESWTNTATSLGLGWNWKDPTRYRCYWGKSYNYAKTDGNYPLTSGDGNLVAPGNSQAGDMNAKYLHYITAAQIGNAVSGTGSSDYCFENTNTAALAQTRSALTSVLLKTRICDKDGGALDLVRYNGLLYNKETYLGYVPNSLGLNAYYEDGQTPEGLKKYTRIGADYLELATLGDGKVYVKMKETLPTPVYAISGETAAEITDFTAIDTALKEFNETGAEAIAYTGGEMYYNIPIEHLRNNEADDKTIYEANYGVVRNHHYVLSIDKLSRLGKGIFDPDEVIIPNVEDEKETYYIGATIHILSWKLVNQGVEL